MEKFAIFDKSSFPKITVKFSKKIYSFDDYKDFENEWLQCYMEYKDFYFVFDTTDKIPNEYFVDIKVVSDKNTDTYKRELQFQIVNKK